MMILTDAHMLIHETNLSRVFLVAENVYNLTNDGVQAAEATRLEKEFTKDVQIEGVGKSLEFIEIDQKPALVIAYFHSKKLKQRISNCYLQGKNQM